MKTNTYNLSCDSCETGLILIVEKITKNTTTLKVCKCNKCKKQHGIKSIQKLKEYTEEPRKLDEVLDNLFDVLYSENGVTKETEEENPLWTNQ